MKYTGLAFLIIAVCTLLFLRARSKPSIKAADIKPYGDIRQDMFQHGDATETRGDPPRRPANLDKRLPASRAADLRFFHDKERWKTGFDAFNAVLDSILNELDSIDEGTRWFELLSPARRAVILSYNMESEVNNGGFDQFYLNSSGDGAAVTPEAFRLLGLEDLAVMVESANAQFPKGPSPARAARMAQMKDLPESASAAWSELNNQFYDHKGKSPTDASLEFILQHPEEFFK